MHSEFNIILTDQSANTQVSILLASQRKELVENLYRKEFQQICPCAFEGRCYCHKDAQVESGRNGSLLYHSHFIAFYRRG